MSFRNEFAQIGLKDSKLFLQTGSERKESLIEEKSISRSPAPIQVKPRDEKEFTQEEIQQYTKHILDALAVHPYACSIIKKALRIRKQEKITILLYKDIKCCAPIEAYDKASIICTLNECTITTIATTEPSELIRRVMFELCNAANDLLCAITDKNQIDIIRMGPELLSTSLEEAEYKTWQMMNWIMKSCPRSIYWSPTFRSCLFFHVELYPDLTFDQYMQHVNKKVYLCCGESHKSRYEEQWKKLVLDFPLPVLLLAIFIEDDLKCLKNIAYVYKMQEVFTVMKEYHADYQRVFEHNQGKECLKFLTSSGYSLSMHIGDKAPVYKLLEFARVVREEKSDDVKQKDTEYKSISQRGVKS